MIEGSAEDVDEEVTVSLPSTSVEGSVLVNAEERVPGVPSAELVGRSWESDSSCANVDKEKEKVGAVAEIVSRLVGKGRSAMVVEIVVEVAGFSWESETGKIVAAGRHTLSVKVENETVVTTLVTSDVLVMIE